MFARSWIGRIGRNGTNTLAILPPTAVDDIVVGDFRLAATPVKATLTQAMLELRVTDAESKAGLPCRLTIVDAEGALATLQPATTNTAELAARPGVLYARDGAARVGVLPGQYTVYASRGFEYSVATQAVNVAAGETKSLAFAIHRVVPTRGWVAADSSAVKPMTLTRGERRSWLTI